MSYGPTPRSKPRLQVLRGWDPMSPNTLTTTAYPGETIRSGQLVSKVYDSGLSKYKFVLGNAAGAIPVLAWSDSADMDVVESGTLTGLSCAGNFELQTGYFDVSNDDSPYAANVYVEGTALTWSAATLGNVCPADTGDVIIGYVSRVYGPKQLNDTANAVWEDSSVAPANSKVIVFQTAFAGATK